MLPSLKAPHLEFEDKQKGASAPHGLIWFEPMALHRAINLSFFYTQVTLTITAKVRCTLEPSAIKLQRL
eukprot:c35319_g1_i1 orf=2-205(-)